MNHRETVNGWLGELSKLAEKDFSLGDNGICGMQTESGMRVLLELAEDSGRLYAWSEIFSFKEESEQRALEIKREAMSANLLGRETRGAVLGLHHNGEILTLHYPIAVDDTDHRGFINLLGNFRETARQLQTRFRQVDRDETDADAENTPAKPMSPQNLSPFEGGWGIRA